MRFDLQCLSHFLESINEVNTSYTTPNKSRDNGVVTVMVILFVMVISFSVLDSVPGVPSAARGTRFGRARRGSRRRPATTRRPGRAEKIIERCSWPGPVQQSRSCPPPPAPPPVASDSQAQTVTAPAPASAATQTGSHSPGSTARLGLHARSSSSCEATARRACYGSRPLCTPSRIQSTLEDQ
jgi:hypothetical protein